MSDIYDIFNQGEEETNKYQGDEALEVATLDKLEELIFSNESDKSSEEYCLVCGNTGRAYNSPFECPKCHRRFKGEVQENKVIDTEEGLKVPRKYIEKGDWRLEKTDGSEDGFYGNLEAILESYDYRAGGLDTMFIIAPPGSGCRIWAYTLLKANEAKGAKIERVMSVVDAMEEKRLKDVDVLVLTLPRFKLTESLEFLEYLIYDRETNGKATFILTNIPKALILKEGFRGLSNAAFLIKEKKI